MHECHSRHHVTATDQSAYVSSALAASTGIGSTSCPWQVRAAEGQRINLTLLAFVDAQTAAAGSQKSCYDVAVIRDGASRRGVTACSGQPPQQVILVSDTSAIELEFVATNMASDHVAPRQAAQFIIHYQCKQRIAISIV